jgi:transcriptional regulator with XRE-family HTH domain
MPKGKSIHLAEYPLFLDLLVGARKAAGLTQVQLAKKANLSQPYVSAVERGGLRLDTLQLRTWLRACGSDLGSFGVELEDRLASFERGKAAKKSARTRKAT